MTNYQIFYPFVTCWYLIAGCINICICSWFLLIAYCVNMCLFMTKSSKLQKLEVSYESFFPGVTNLNIPCLCHMLVFNGGMRQYVRMLGQCVDMVEVGGWLRFDRSRPGRPHRGREGKAAPRIVYYVLALPLNPTFQTIAWYYNKKKILL